MRANEEANPEEIGSGRPMKTKTAAPMLVSMCELVCQRKEDGVMKMGEIDIHDYARQVLEAHGEMAVVEAAQKARRGRNVERYRSSLEANARAARKLSSGEQTQSDISPCGVSHDFQCP